MSSKRYIYIICRKFYQYFPHRNTSQVPTFLGTILHAMEGDLYGENFHLKDSDWIRETDEQTIPMCV